MNIRRRRTAETHAADDTRTPTDGAPPAAGLRSLSILAILNALVAGAVAAGLLVLEVPSATVAYALIAAVAVNIATVLLALVRRPGPAIPNRRQYMRLRIAVDAKLNGGPCRVQDLSPGGARVLVEGGGAPVVGDEATLALDLHGTAFDLTGLVRRRLEHGFHTRVALEFVPGQDEQLAELALAMLHESPAEGDRSGQAREAA